MTFTKKGKALAKAEPIPTITETGATAHMKACQYDAGKTIILTGRNVHGRRFHKRVGSVYAAYATMQAVSGLERAWLIDDRDRRTLVMSR